MKITVVVPFYNTPAVYFTECLHALKKLNPYEVILVDDCSTDEKLVKIAESSGFKYLKTPYQSGFDGLPFNLGVQHARGDYICRVDSDDVLLELPTEMPCEIHFGNLNRVKRPENITLEELLLAPRAIFNAMVIKKELLVKYQLAEDPNVFSDVLLVLRLLYNKHTFDVHKKINYIYRRRGGSMQASQSQLYHRLSHIQTVARFCQLENIESKEVIHYLELAMLNTKYGSKSQKVYKNLLAQGIK
ncbi:MAG: glycosyltransferase family 2 protein [Bacteroidetes bacterium]|nr:MAG: glycosyltransferase family 2 protein [Bacteroidota bacterium]